MTEQEIIEKILRPNGEDLLMPHEKQFDCQISFILRDNSCSIYKKIDDRTNNLFASDFINIGNYIRGLLQPIPNFSTAMQFLEKGAVLGMISPKTVLGTFIEMELIYFDNEKKDFEFQNGWWSSGFMQWDPPGAMLNSIVKQELIYTPWINRETGKTIQEIKDFCDDILGSN